MSMVYVVCCDTELDTDFNDNFIYNKTKGDYWHAHCAWTRGKIDDITFEAGCQEFVDDGTHTADYYLAVNTIDPKNLRTTSLCATYGKARDLAQGLGFPKETTQITSVTLKVPDYDNYSKRQY